MGNLRVPSALLQTAVRHAATNLGHRRLTEASSRRRTTKENFLNKMSSRLATFQAATAHHGFQTIKWQNSSSGKACLWAGARRSTSPTLCHQIYRHTLRKQSDARCALSLRSTTRLLAMFWYTLATPLTFSNFISGGAASRAGRFSGTRRNFGAAQAASRLALSSADSTLAFPSTLATAGTWRTLSTKSFWTLWTLCSNLS